MEQTTTTLTAHTDPLIRSRIYQLFSSGFAYPGAESFTALQTGEYLEELEDHLSALAHGRDCVAEPGDIRESVRSSLRETELTDFETQYVRTFDAGDLEPLCPPYEGLHHEGGDRIAIMLEVSEFYRQFGLKMNAAEGKREIPDNLRAELEFLHFLAVKEAQAREEGNRELLRGYILAQRDFLERHLVKWLPKFSEKLRSCGAAPFHVELAGMASKFVAAELELANAHLLDFAAGEA